MNIPKWLVGSEAKAFEALGRYYNIIEYVSNGGFARVFKVEKDNNFYAAKILFEKVNLFYPNGLEQEARRTQKVSDHPNIITFHDYISEGVLLTNWERGKTLGKLINEKEEISHNEIREVKNQIGDAIKYAHNKNVLHRDISLKNIIYGSKMLLYDWGLTDEMEISRKPGVVAGTQGYLSREVLLGNETTQLSDYFSLGITLKSLAQGKGPSTEFIVKNDKENVKELEALGLPYDLEFSIGRLISNTPFLRVEGMEKDLYSKLFDDLF